ncbi:MAG: AraC family transcriptional regulator [Clostridia bacterium]|nr:AraC family transcriptional regulator [Clostridia bacterium]
MKCFEDVLIRTNMHYGIAQAEFPGSKMYLHYHDHYELYFQEQGERRYFIKNNTYLLQSGDLLFIPPFALHQADAESPQEHKRTVFYFDDLFCAELMNMSKELFAPFRQEGFILSIDPQNQQQLKELISLMVQEQTKREKGWLIRSKLLLGEVLLLIYRCCKSNKNTTEKHLALPENSIISEAIQYIQSNFHNKLSLEDVAGRLFIHPDYFCRLFKQEMGISFVEYVNNTRIEYAKGLLEKNKMTVKEVSELSGFENDSTFSRTFKSFTGISPSEYRKRNQQKP